MQEAARLMKRTYGEINGNRRRLLHIAYDSYPELAFCDPERFNWSDIEARTNIFDLYYLFDSGFIDVVNSVTSGRRQPDFFMLTPRGADLMEIPGRLEERFPAS